MTNGVVTSEWLIVMCIVDESNYLTYYGQSERKQGTRMGCEIHWKEACLAKQHPFAPLLDIIYFADLAI